MRAGKGISPVIATVIIVAVTIALVIAVAGWALGLWGHYGEYESLKILPSSRIEGSNIILEVYNPGSKPVTITTAEIEGQTITIDEAIQPGESKTITKPLPAGFTPQPVTAYTVKVYTAEGNVYQTIIYARW